MKRFKVLTTAEMLTRYIVEAEDKEQVEKNLFDLKILSNEVLDSGEEVIYSVEEILDDGC